LKTNFKSIRNYLAANNVGTTRDEVLAQQLINIIFCNIYDEKYTAPDEIIRFRAGIGEPPQDIEKRIYCIFDELKTKYPEVIEKEDKITLDTNSIVFIIGELQNYSLMDCERDVIADAFETFIDHALKGGQGQFFTPRNVVKMIVDILQPNENDKIIDPACGSGGFLIESLKSVWLKMDKKYQKLGWKYHEIEKEKTKIATNNFRGIDKDYFLSKVAKAYMNLVGDGTSGIFCEDSLEEPKNWRYKTQLEIQLESFGIVVTNPPFGDKIKVVGKDKLQQYDLANNWKLTNNTYSKENLKTESPPQILFIERCLNLLHNGGRMAIVLPEGTFGNPSDRYIWSFLAQNTRIEAIINLPEETFQPNTHFKTSVLILKKEKIDKDYSIFMATPYTCGHNKNGKIVYKTNNDGSTVFDTDGNQIVNDEILQVSEKYRLFKTGIINDNSHLGFEIKFSQIKNWIYIPDYYDPDLQKELNDMVISSEYEIKSIQQLLDDKVIQIKRGNEIGSQFYGRGDIPFIRTSDIVNWELKIDPIKCVPEEIYLKYKKLQDVKQNDILFVKDGTFLIGRSAIVTEKDEKIIIQSHLLKIRVLNEKIINSHYLLYLLNCPIVRKQIEKFTFVQGTISTIGERFNEIKLPIHIDKEKIKNISEEVKDIIKIKSDLKLRVDNLVKTQ
jgi:type I restriction enzyme M protein